MRLARDTKPRVPDRLRSLFSPMTSYSMSLSKSRSTLRSSHSWRTTLLVSWLSLVVLFGLCVIASSSRASQTRPIEFWTIEPNEGQSAGGHTAIRIGEWIYHVEHRGDGMIVDRRADRREFERVYRWLGNRSIDVIRMDLPVKVEQELESKLRLRYFENQQRLRRLAEAEEDVRWLDRALLLGRLEVIVPGLGLLAAGKNDCIRPGAEFRLARKREIVRKMGRGAVEKRIVRARQSLHRALRTATVDDRASGVADGEDPPAPLGIVRSVVEAAQVLVALEAIRDCRGPAQGRLVPAIPDEVGSFDRNPASRNASRKSWIAIEAKVESNFLRLLDSDRRDSGLALMLAWGRLSAMDRTRSTGRLVFFQPYAEAGEEADRLTAGVPVPWHDARRARTRILLEQRMRELLSEDDENIESKMFRVEAARHLLEHAEAHELHLDPKSMLGPQATEAARYPSKVFQLPWPSGVTTRDLKAQRERIATHAGRLRRELEGELGYSLFAQNCVTELLVVLDSALSSDPSTAEFGNARNRDRESLFSFVPVVAGRIVRRNLPLIETTRLSSLRESTLRKRRLRGTKRWVEAIRESNTLSSTTYWPHPGDSTFLLFSDRSLWIRPIAGLVNLVTGLGATVVGVLQAPIDRGRLARRGLQGVAMSVPELFFFSVRRGSYVIAPPLGWPDERVGAFEEGGT